MSINIDDPKQPRNGKVFVGLLLLVLGMGFLLQQLDFFFIPHWLISWPSGLIVWGLYIGAKHNFQNSAWFIMVVVGTAWLLDRALPGYNVHNIIWPVAIISFGIWLIMKRNHSNNDSWSKYQCRNGKHTGSVITPVTPVDDATPAEPGAIPPSGSTTIPPAGNPFTNPLRGDDYLDAVSVFGGVKKTILSKNFRGGEIVNIFGGAELDFIQADIHGRVVIDITQIFGGTKIIVPSNWQVVSDLAAVFASVDDKRMKTTALPESDKVLVLKGVSIFAGVDIRSY